ncbi:MAG: protein kinase [Sandaracinaceae bacterium]
MDLTGRTLLGKYEVVSLLGSGGMGTVWSATHALTARKLAVKVLDESFLKNEKVMKRFGREARAASSIAHPGIVEVIDIDQTDEGVPFMVMEFLEGETLASRIEARGRLDQDEMLEMAALLLDALEAAHEHGVIHRDLKPENIYLVPAGRQGEIVKILDFGISHMQEDQGQKLTMTGSVLGTPHYMSPEQALGDVTVDHRADLYAMGVVLYECVVGDVPFDAPNYNKLLRLILDEEPPGARSRHAEITAEVERVIQWAMSKEVEARVGSAREMRDWLQRAADGEMPGYEPPTSPFTRRRKKKPKARPAGTLPMNRGVASMMAGKDLTPPEDEDDGEWDFDVDLSMTGVGGADSLEAELPDLDLSPPKRPVSSRPPPREPPQSSPGTRIPASEPPPSNSKLELDLFAPNTDAADLELDESALPAARSVPPPGVGVTPSPSSSGTFRAPGVTSSAPPATGLSRSSLPPRSPSVSGNYAMADLHPQPDEYDEPEEGPSWPRYLMFGLLGIGAFVGVVFLVNALVRPGIDDEQLVTPPVVQAPDPEPERPATPQWVSVRVIGVPNGGRVTLDGLPASTTVRVRHGGEHVLEVIAAGYETRRIEFTADRNRTVNARMRPGEGTVREAP